MLIREDAIHKEMRKWKACGLYFFFGTCFAAGFDAGEGFFASVFAGAAGADPMNAA